MSKRIRLELTLDELHETIADSVARTLHANANAVARIVVGSVHRRDELGRPCECNACNHSGEHVRALSRTELDDVYQELGRNAAGILSMAFAAEDAPEDYVACGDVVQKCKDDATGEVTTYLCKRRRDHIGFCSTTRD